MRPPPAAFPNLLQHGMTILMQRLPWATIGFENI
jgi:hypothetical protein